MSGVPSISLSPDLVVIDPDENFHRIPMTITNDYFLGKFPVEKVVFTLWKSIETTILVFLWEHLLQKVLFRFFPIFDLEKISRQNARCFSIREYHARFGEFRTIGTWNF